MIYLCIIVYNRFKNLQHWLECWDKCNRHGTEVVVIHNYDEDRPEYRKLCEDHKAIYIPRPNVGFDIGAFQDICRRRLRGFPKDWKRLLWVSDDNFPMSVNFVKEFENVMAPRVGVACMDLNPYVRPHIRTTGFMIDRKVAETLVFPADPITTKEQCYQFEHRDPTKTFLAQIQKMGFRVIQVAPETTSPLWDTGYQRKLDRQVEHNNLFGPDNEQPKVTFICPIYKSYPYIITSLLAQTNSNWELWLIHDGPGSIDTPNDPRVKFMATETRGEHWGHPIRSKYLQQVQTEYVVITNPDNYLVPPYIEYMMRAFKPDTVGVYCSEMVHSYNHWQTVSCSIARGYIDCSGMMLRTKKAQAVGWNVTTDHSSDWFFFEGLLKRYGASRFIKTKGTLLVHN